MKFITALAVIASAASSAVASTMVTNTNDSGEGSLRAAIEDSGTTSITIDIKGNGIININSSLEFAGDGPLTITGDGNGKRPTIKGGDFDLLKVTSDLTVKNVDFEGQGGFSIYSQSTEPIPGKGIYVDIPDDATGVIKVELEDVQVSNVANHGVHISDCSSETCGNGNTGEGQGSDASVHLVLKNVVVSNVGQGKFDGDGVRVDERGPGDIIFKAESSAFEDCGADGVELDEAGEGDVIADVESSRFLRNGNYCDIPECRPLPDSLEEPSCLAAVELLDESCNDGGELDLDDGFDIDEDDDGDLYVTIENSSANENFDEAFDFDEAGNGVLDATFKSVNANENVNEGLKCSSEGEGDNNNVSVKVIDSTVNDNKDDGMQFEAEEDNVGIITVVIENTVSTGNRKKDLKVEQKVEDPEGTLSIDEGSIIEKIKVENVDIVYV